MAKWTRRIDVSDVERSPTATRGATDRNKAHENQMSPLDDAEDVNVPRMHVANAGAASKKAARKLSRHIF